MEPPVKFSTLYNFRDKKPPKLEGLIIFLDRSSTSGRRTIRGVDTLRSILKRVSEKEFGDRRRADELITCLVNGAILHSSPDNLNEFYFDPDRANFVWSLCQENAPVPPVRLEDRAKRLAELVQRVKDFKASLGANPANTLMKLNGGSPRLTVGAGAVQLSREPVGSDISSLPPSLRIPLTAVAPGMVASQVQSPGLCSPGVMTYEAIEMVVMEEASSPANTSDTPSLAALILASVPDQPAKVESLPPPLTPVATTETAPVSRPPVAALKVLEVSIVGAALASGSEQNTLTLQVSEGPPSEAQDQFGSLHVLSDLSESALAERRALSHNLAAYADAGQAAIGAEIQRREAHRLELEAANRAHANLLGRHLSMADRRTALLARAASLRQEVEADKPSI